MDHGGENKENSAPELSDRKAAHTTSNVKQKEVVIKQYSRLVKYKEKQNLLKCQ
jgi:hypothetical protein